MSVTSLSPSSAFVQFLHSVASWQTQLKENTRVCMVTGNEGADLDSIVSALTLAFYYSVAGLQYFIQE
jgi:hypothetical protein